MFERRLKIFLSLLVASGVVLFGRAFAVQVVGRDAWVKAETRIAAHPAELTATTRGRLLDARGVPLAVDTACTDACVDYRALVEPPEPKWVESVARARVRQRYGTTAEFRAQVPTAKGRKAVLDDAARGVEADVAAMWVKLGTLYRPADAGEADGPAGLDDVRREVVRQVELRRRLLWTDAYRRGQARSATSGHWLRWLGGGGGGATAPADDAAPASDSAAGPDIDAYAVTTGEQQSSHVVLRGLDPDSADELGKSLEHFPGLSLRPSTRRWYPLAEVACHLLGRVGGPTPDELRLTADDDPTRRYEATDDDVGRDGVEALCEPLLRGTRGRVDRGPDGAVVDRQPFVPGRDVKLTVDADLQGRLQGLLEHVVEHGKLGDDPHAQITPDGGVSMHGAIVVLDVKTGEVRAMASNPAFDVNRLAAKFAALTEDVVEAPTVDRATCDAVEPGSTVKPLLGLGAVTQGTVGPTEGIECTGYLYLPVIAPDGARTTVLKRVPKGGSCWVVSEYGEQLRKAGLPVNHHRIPTGAEHQGIFGNPDGWLTFSDAIERSCDIYFETVADRMGPGDLCRWYDRFGLGRPSGIGVHEVAGLREDLVRRVVRDGRMNNCYAGMGQGTTLATPLQVANAAATIARGGVWVRPRLLPADEQAALDAARPRPNAVESVDLHLSPAALAQARVGMRNVVTAPGGTGKLDGLPAWLTVAAKTGTADTSPFSYLAKQPDGRLVRQVLAPVVRGGPETATPWCRSETGHDFVHAWYMGYAPADHPQVAFAVLIEYAGIGGGAAAGPVAAGVLDACVADGYLRPPGAAAAVTTGPATNP